MADWLSGYIVGYRAGLIGMFEDRGVRPNRAAYFRGPPLWTLKIGYHSATHCNADKRTRNAEPDTFCEHTMQQNATAAGAPPRAPLGLKSSKR